MDLLDFLRDRAHRHGWIDRAAYLDEDRELVLSHRQVFDCAEHLASQLARSGVTSLQRVALLMGDRLEWPVAFLACARVKAVAVLMNPDLTEATRHNLLAAVGARVELSWSDGVLTATSRDSTAMLFSWQLGEALRAPISTLAASSHGDLEEVPLYVQFSSGTTSSSKAVAHRSVDLLDFFRNIAENALEITPDDRICSVSQLYFTYGFNNEFVYPMFSGCSVVLRRSRRHPEDVLRTIATYQATMLFTVPSSLAGTVRLIEKKSMRAATTLRAVVSAGEQLPNFLEQATIELLSAPVYEQFGCTEVGNAICANGPRRRSPSSCGFPCEGVEIELRPSLWPAPADALALEEHAAGDVWVRSSTIPSTAETAEGPVQLIDDRGWLCTGDIGYWNKDGALVLVGRSDDIVMNGGISVSAATVEHCIRRSRLVADTAVTSLLDPTGKSYLAALVVPEKDSMRSSTDFERSLFDHCRSNLERFCVPHVYLQVEEVPRTPSGKIRRDIVRTAATELVSLEAQRLSS